MLKRSLLTVGLAAAVAVSTTLPATSAPPQRDRRQAKTYVTIDYGPAKEAGANLVFLGRVYSKKAPFTCTIGRKLVLYRTVNSGSGTSRTKVGTVGIRKRIKDPTSYATGETNWHIFARLPGRYYARVPATERCAGATSRVLDAKLNTEPDD